MFRLSGIFLLKPRYLIPSYKTTKETIVLCNNLFGYQHHSNNRTNAFRHALWNFKLCQRCLKTAGSSEKSAVWAKTITDLHEELLPNDELCNQMDLHNNRIGRDLFRKFSEINFDVISHLMQMMETAEKVENIKQVKEAGSKLIFTEN
ncbi:hypothetical protein LZ575_13810 [Antarcticibacterium sp. 1MA-6-2]|uniref:DUF6973 domain-containing protein n=1 Tax=Antarcticibacterium sp. 1MA-6-2 TaxID=2908210 RepID=UPI001F16AC66|nr:hypothetical protein [Antarcticibacterium sp. 1MA-6-2]UJH90013.1 hypothetical protein LZ575_13810 [Antarcticibacterium sp. 1MA-6-2]